MTEIKELNLKEVNDYLRLLENENGGTPERVDFAKNNISALRQRAEEIMKDILKGKEPFGKEDCDTMKELLEKGMGETRGMKGAAHRDSIGKADKEDRLILKSMEMVDKVRQGEKSPYEKKQEKAAKRQARKEKLKKLWNATKNAAKWVAKGLWNGGKMIATGIATGVTLAAAGVATGAKWGYDKTKEQIKKYQDKKLDKFNASLQTKEGAAKAAKGDLSKLNADQIKNIWDNIKDHVTTSKEKDIFSSYAEKMMQQIQANGLGDRKSEDEIAIVKAWHAISNEINEARKAGQKDGVHSAVDDKINRNNVIAEKINTPRQEEQKKQPEVKQQDDLSKKDSDSPENVMPPAENVNVQANNNLNQQGQQVEVNAPEAKVNAQNVKDVTDEADKVINGEREQNDPAEGQNNPVTETPVADVDAALRQVSLTESAGYIFAASNITISSETEQDITRHIAGIKSRGRYDHNAPDVKRLHAKMTGKSKDKKSRNYSDISEKQYNKYLETWREQFPELSKAFREIDNENIEARKNQQENIQQKWQEKGEGQKQGQNVSNSGFVLPKAMERKGRA